MSYKHRLFAEAWKATWDLVVGQTAPKFVIGGVIIVVTLALYYRWKKFEDYWQTLRATAALIISTALVFWVIFMWQLLFATPKALVETAHAEAKDAKTAKISAEQERDKLRRRIESLSPTAQTAEIKQLKDTVKHFQDRAAEEEKREWPPLSDAQIAEWTEALAPRRNDIEVIAVLWSQDVEAKRLFRSIQAAGKAAGIPVQNWGGSADGDKIAVQDNSGKVGKLIADLLNKAGYPVELDPNATYDGKTVAIYVPDRLARPSATPDTEASPH